MTRIKTIGLFLLGLCVVYTLATFFLPKYLSNNYGKPFNFERKVLHLLEIGEEWRLDSTAFLGLGNYSIEDQKSLSALKLQIEDERLYCQYWSPAESEGIHSSFVGKRIYYWESFWLWKNKRVLEQDLFENIEVNDVVQEVAVGFDFENDSAVAHWSQYVSSTYVKNIYQKANTSDYEVCGTAVMAFMKDMDSSRFVHIWNAQAILREWEN